MGLGNKIREARISRQMTQKEVVGEYMTRNMLSKIENGSALPSVKTLEYLATVLKVPTGYLMEDYEPGCDEKAGGDLSWLALAGELLDALEQGGGDAVYVGNLARALRICLFLLVGDEARADQLIVDAGEPSGPGAGHLLGVMEERYKKREDYKAAYACARKRMEAIAAAR